MTTRKDKTEIFCELPCLLEKSRLYTGQELRNTHFKGMDKRYIVQYLQKFIVYNRDYFAFLGIEPSIIGTDQAGSISFRTTSYIGSVPLRSPIDGKQIGDFVVSPRFMGRDRFSGYIEILDLLGSSISPEFFGSIPLNSARIFRPPLYLEAVKFVAALEEVLRRSWRKFDTVNSILTWPTGHVDWNKYSRSENKVENRTRFPVRRNILSEIHREYSELRHVFDICREELLSSTVPPNIRNQFRRRLAFVEEQLYVHKPAVATKLHIRAADPPWVKLAKVQGNIILNNAFVQGTAWRVDFNDVFEKFVQFIFKEIAKTRGGSLKANPRFRARSSRSYAWELRHIEPDAIYRDSELTAFVDAKYKSHLFNRSENSELLRSDFRHDLHQILAYMSFSDTANRIGVLCYPSTEVDAKVTSYQNNLNGVSKSILLAGIPMAKDAIPQIVEHLGTALDRFKLRPSPSDIN